VKAASLVRALLAALLFLPSVLEAQDAPPGYDGGIYDLRVASLRSVSVPVLLDARGDVLVPLRPLLEATGAPFRVVPDSGRAVVARPRGVGEAVLDVRAGTLTVTARAAMAPGEAVVWAGDVYATAARAAQLLEAEAEVDAAELAVRFTRAVPFPAQERAEADARRGLESVLGASGPRVDPSTVAFVPRSGGAVAEWGVSTAFPGQAAPTAAHLAVGVGVYGGMLQLGASFANPGPGVPTTLEPTARFRRVFPLRRWVQQVQLGDVSTENLRVRLVRGASISNAPFVRDPLFGEVALDPRLPAGWEYEVYQNGRLLGFSRGAARTPVPVQLGYGSTPVRVRLYGPSGEQVESQVVYLVPVLQLPAGETQYALGGGACARGQECTALGYVDLRRGVTRSLTLLAGTDVVRDSAGVRVQPYGGASILPAPGWALELQGMAGAFVRASLQNLGTGPLSGSLSGGVTFPELQEETVLGPDGFAALPARGTRWSVDATGAARMAGGRTLSGTARVEGSEGGGLERVRASLLGRVRGVILEGSAEHVASELLGRRDVGAVRATLPVDLLRRGILPGALLSVEAGAGADGLDRAELGTYAQVGRVVLSATGRWDAQSRRPALLLTSGVNLGYARAQTRAAAAGGRVTGGLTVTGAAAFAGGAGVAPLPFGGLGQAGIAGTVFHDANGDGAFGPGDEPVEGARVFVGGALVRTDAAGRYQTWSVLPYEVVQVRVDTAQLADPSWTPARPADFVRPSPHLFTRVDVPLVQTREVSGTVVPGRGVPTAGGVTVEVVDERGTVVDRVLTFSDGGFYIGRIRPGDYQLRVSESSLRTLGARAVPAATLLRVPASGPPLVEVPAIQLVRGP
jgi:hypothetical protein